MSSPTDRVDFSRRWNELKRFAKGNSPWIKQDGRLFFWSESNGHYEPAWWLDKNTRQSQLVKNLRATRPAPRGPWRTMVPKKEAAEITPEMAARILYLVERCSTCVSAEKVELYPDAHKRGGAAIPKMAWELFLLLHGRKPRPDERANV